MTKGDRQAFPDHEFARRLDAIREHMSARGLDAMLLVRPENIFYASGYRAAHVANRSGELHCVLVPRTAPPRLITRELEAVTVTTQWTPEPLLFRDHEDPYELLRKLIDGLGLDAAVIGVEERFLRVSQHRRIAAALPGATLVDASGLVEEVAVHPSELEAACMQRAAEVADHGLRVGLAALVPGVHPYDVVGAIHQAMYASGQTDFDKSLVAVWSGPDGGLMHDTRTTERIEPGHVVTIEIMGVHLHYRAGVQACAYIGGPPPEDVADAYRLVVEMNQAARAVVKAGVRAGEVWNAANEVHRDARGTDYFRRVGGSMGLTNFTVDLVKGREDELVPGMSLLIQTLVNEPVLLTCASTVHVTPTGSIDLTHPVLALEHTVH